MTLPTDPMQNRTRRPIAAPPVQIQPGRAVWQAPPSTPAWPITLAIATIGIALMGSIGALQTLGLIESSPAGLFEAETTYPPSAMDNGTESNMDDETESPSHDRATGMPNWYMDFEQVQSVVAMAVLGFGIVSAILMLKRRRPAIPMMTGYAVAHMLLLLIAAFVTIAGIGEMDTSVVPGGNGQYMRTGMITAAIVQLLWLAWPIFLIFWFRRQKVRELVSTWS